MDQSQYKPGFHGMQGTAGGQAYSVETPPPATPPYTVAAAAPPSSMNLPGYILRIIAIVLTLIATVVMGAARETVILTVTDPITGFSTTDTGTTKSTYSAAFVYFIVANAVVFFYSVVSLGLTIANKAGASGGGMVLPVTIGDVVMVTLLFSSNGAAAAISVVLENGQENLAGWTKICNVVGGFCARVNAAIVLSMVAALLYVLLVVLGLLRLRKPY